MEIEGGLITIHLRLITGERHYEELEMEVVLTITMSSLCNEKLLMRYLKD